MRPITFENTMRGGRGRGRRRARRFSIENLERRRLLATLLVNSTADNGSEGTLRWAILQANQDAAPDEIDFDLSGDGPYTIVLGSALPALSNPLTIDGTSQRG